MEDKYRNAALEGRELFTDVLDKFLRHRKSSSTGATDSFLTQEQTKKRGSARKRDREGRENLSHLENEDREEFAVGELRIVRELLNGTFSLREFIKEAAQISADMAEDHDTYHSERYRSTTWMFVRLLKTRVEFVGLPARQASRKIPWRDLDCFFSEVDKDCFLKEWGRVKFPAGENPLVTALKMAVRKPLIVDPDFEKYCLFVSLAGWLQRLSGDSDIILPIDPIAALLNTSPKTISNYRQAACDESFLTLTKKANRTLHRAARYRFNFDLFPELKEATSDG